MKRDGVVVWFTGAPSSGKSTLARGLAEELRELRADVVVLDGDEVRQALTPQPGYDSESRDRFYETLARLAALLAGQGLVVLVAATAHRAAYRQRARELAPRFVEVLVDVPEDERRARDDKGLYRSAASGVVSGLPGADLVYETPSAPEIVAEGGRDLLALERLVSALSPTNRLLAR
jgi:adenylylsulfate kinase